MPLILTLLMHIGPRLASNIPQSNVCFTKPADGSFALRETHYAIIQHLGSSLHVNKAMGLDGISVGLLKEAGTVITPFLKHVTNYPSYKWILSREMENIQRTALI